MNVTVLTRCLLLATSFGVCAAYATRMWINEIELEDELDPWSAYEQMPVQQPDDSSGKEQGGRGFNLMPDLRRGMSRYPGDEGKNQTKVKAAFKTSVAPAARSTVTIQCDDKDAALGAIVSADGQILTKASELQGRIAVKLRGGKTYPATVLGASREHDLALLKISAKDLEPVTWRTGDDPALGSFLVTSGSSGDDPVAIGVMSVKARKISAPSGLLGILLEQGEFGPQILRVVEGSAAEAAGLKPNDYVTQVDDKKVLTREALIETIANYRPGDKLKLIVKRGGQTLTISAILGRPETGRPATNDKGKGKRPDDERLAGDLSVRRGGFPTVMQHDTVLRPYQIGGPIVDLDGRAVGLNIARADRVSTYALPVKTVTAALTDLQAGRLPAPVEIRGTDKDRLGVRVKSLEEAVGVAAKTKSAAETEANKAKRKVADAEKIVADIKKQTTAGDANAKKDAAKDAKLAKELTDAEKYLAEVKRDFSTKETAVKSSVDAEKTAKLDVETTKKLIERLPQ